MRKKGQGLPLSVIIIAAIAILVLVVLIAVFTGRIAIFGEEIEAQTTICCEQKNVAANKCGSHLGGTVVLVTAKCHQILK